MHIALQGAGRRKDPDYEVCYGDGAPLTPVRLVPLHKHDASGPHEEDKGGEGEAKREGAGGATWEDTTIYYVGCWWW